MEEVTADEVAAADVAGRAAWPCPIFQTITPTRMQGVEFGISADGFPVARVGELLLAMVTAITFPDLFTSHERKCADETIRNSWPDVWERTYGGELAPGESWAKDRTAFDRAHPDDWIAASAIQSDHHPDMTEVIATRGGRRNGHAEEMRFLVPAPNTQRVAPSASSSILAVTLPKRGLPVL